MEKINKKAQEMAETYLNGNISDAHKWVGNSAARLCAIQEALAPHGSGEQRRHMISYRLFISK